jgi:CDP-glycerol glycerophosphotransferase (TagB/SpsB family)
MNIKKEITFIYKHKSELQNIEPIRQEANERGYKTKLSDNQFEKCEIGVYCQHVNFPHNSKFSVIMLHDAIQSYEKWPNLWKYEPWNLYDVGFLPGKQWIDNWKKSSMYDYSRTKYGVFEAGWPKADIMAAEDFEKRSKSLKNKLEIDDSKPTVLYAPSWENDGKQDDFVQAMLTLNVNIIIKHVPLNPKEFPDIVRNIKEMANAHKTIKGVNIIDPAVSIIDAIALCDILVSDESSTMMEATLMGKPAVAVTDWLIPDVKPSRYACSVHPFTVKTQKYNLVDTVNKVLLDYEKYSTDSKKYCDSNFSNIGSSSKIIIDVIDSIIEEKQIIYNPVEPDNNLILESDEEKKIRKKQYRNNYIYNRYIEKNALLRNSFELYRKVRSKK